MGNEICCNSESSFTDPNALVDLPMPNVGQLRDLYAIWEYNTPFKRTHFLSFQRCVNKAEITDGAQGYVTLNSLSLELKTNAWSALKSARSSELRKLLLSDAFKDPKKNQAGEQIDKNILMLYGILHCSDSKIPINKAKALYDIL